MNISMDWIRRLGKTPQQVPDINLIPSDYATGLRISNRNLLVALVLLEVLIIVALFPSYGQNALDSIRGGEEPAAVTNPVEENLKRQINQVSADIGALEAIQALPQALNAERVQWPQLLDLIFNKAPQDVIVSPFLVEGNAIALSGRATKRKEIFAYEKVLRDSEFSQDVIST